MGSEDGLAREGWGAEWQCISFKLTNNTLCLLRLSFRWPAGNEIPPCQAADGIL